MADETVAPAAPVESTEVAPATNAETTEDGKAVAKPVTEAEVKAAIKKYKLKFGKETREVDENQIVNLAQKGWASDEKFQKASGKEKMMADLISKFEEDPDAFIKYIGKDPVEIYKKQLAKELQRRVMTPEQRELADAKARLAEYEAGEKRRKEDEHKQQVDKLQAHYEQEYDKQMSEAIVAGGLPKTAKTIKRMAQLAYKNLEMGLDLPWGSIAEMVKDEYKQDMKELFGASDADKLIEMFGPEVAKKLSGASLKNRAIDPEPVTEKNRSAAKPRELKEVPKYATDDDWETRMKKFKNS